ncbi:MAG: WbqC family protein [Bacteroidetes bacterium]|nr:WbqC family protein [Bacteroidota bacterium]
MKISIHQPSYWPWLGLLDKIAKSDVYVILDNVEISKGSFQYRNQLLCNGTCKYITLPIDFNSKTLLKDITIKDVNWKEKQLSFIKNYYFNSPHFRFIYPDIEKLYLTYNSNDACGFIIETMKKSFEMLAIEVTVKRASHYQFHSSRGDLVFDICTYFKADAYISGQGAKNYMSNEDFENFLEANIDIEFQEFSHPIYKQNIHHDYIEGLSVLDLLFWNGIKNSRKIFWASLKNG